VFKGTVKDSDAAGRILSSVHVSKKKKTSIKKVIYGTTKKKWHTILQNGDGRNKGGKRSEMVDQ